jgi:hypothetical protein
MAWRSRGTDGPFVGPAVQATQARQGCTGKGGDIEHVRERGRECRRGQGGQAGV